jgi:large subunit ribosomal protein L3
VNEMLEGIIGRKLGMTQVYRDNGKIESVTAVEAGPCAVTQIKTADKEGYEAVQVGFGETKRLNSAEKGHLKGLGQYRHLREFRVESAGDLKVGDKIDVSAFKPGDRVDVTGISKGKGFAGVVKRHHFKGGPKTHGQSDRERHPGAIGSTTTPGHLKKGLRMAGHMGAERVTALRLEVMKIDPARNLLLVVGAVPGSDNGLVMIKKSHRGS